jgi:hypothetical protein
LAVGTEVLVLNLAEVADLVEVVEIVLNLAD